MKLLKSLVKVAFLKFFKVKTKSINLFLVREKETGKLYAMKTMSKSKIKRDNKVENI
jgi:ribosomal protein L23